MKKKENKNSKKWLFVLSVIVAVICGYFIINRDTLKAFTVVTKGDFKLTVENKWSQEDRKNFADLKWDKIDDIGQSGYQLYQSEDGTTWNNRSLKYGKAIKVLNIYPDDPKSAKLGEWMDELNLKALDGSNLIQVTSESLSNYNANPNKYLKNSADEYQYDVLMFGSWDGNNKMDMKQNAANETKRYLNTGRGVLFGHDTVITIRPVFYANFKNLLGVGYRLESGGVTDTGSSEVKLINNGYLMKYPFEMENDLVLKIPYAHNYELQKKDVGTTWLEFINPSGRWPNPIYDSGAWRGGWYLKTNNNVGMIQTGHSSGDSSIDERKIIANTLYNLSQVSLDNFASDQSVKDDQAPDMPKTSIHCGKEGDDLRVMLDAVDKGKEYQWYIEANTKKSGKKKSDVIKETIISNIAGYFYEVTDSPNSSLHQKVDGYKDSYGRIDPMKYDLYVAPDDDSIKYDTRDSFIIHERTNSEKYLHVLAVDRSNNISQVNSQKLEDLNQSIEFKVERTKDEAKLINLKLDNTLNNKMETLEIVIPKNTVIKDFNSLNLPPNWSLQENNETVDNKFFSFKIKEKNDLATITNFIKNIRFSINTPFDQKGELKIIFYEKDKNTSVISNVTKVCWAEDIPQKVSLKAYDEMGNPIPAADLLLDQKLTIEKKETIVPRTIDFYDFIKLVSIEEIPISPLEWIITNEFQTGNLIYDLRKLTIHSRQVVNDNNKQVVIPKSGFSVLTSETQSGEKTNEFSLTMNSTANNSSIFDTYIIRYQRNEPLYIFSTKIPMNYELIGYVLTTQKEEHQPNANIQTSIQFDVSVTPEVWVTTYIKPVTDTPSLYHWEYKENNLGIITSK